MRTSNLAALIMFSSLAGCAAAPEDESVTEAPIRAPAGASLFAAKKPALPLVDHGGKVLTTSNSYAIYWGDASAFPADLESGMAAMLSGFENSSYLGIAAQYMRGAGVATHYAGTFTDSSAPPSSSVSASTLGSEVCTDWRMNLPSDFTFLDIVSLYAT